MTTGLPEEAEIRRLCLRITREANVVSQPYTLTERRKAITDLIRQAETIKRILGPTHHDTMH